VYPTTLLKRRGTASLPRNTCDLYSHPLIRYNLFRPSTPSRNCPHTPLAILTPRLSRQWHLSCNYASRWGVRQPHPPQFDWLVVRSPGTYARKICAEVGSVPVCSVMPGTRPFPTPMSLLCHFNTPAESLNKVYISHADLSRYRRPMIKLKLDSDYWPLRINGLCEGR